MSKLFLPYAHGFDDSGAQVGVVEYDTTVIEGRTFVRSFRGLREVTDKDLSEYHDTREAALRSAADRLAGVAAVLLKQAEQLRKEAAGV